MYYLAVSPEYFGIIAEKLQTFGLIKENRGYHRVLIEKPFGKDLTSAKNLSKHITNIFSEENTYRIDHYLGKEMLQNVLVIRFANAIFEPIWNKTYIDHVQITSTETLGIDERGGYYDQSGALKDMFQNHLLQFLALIAMEPPERIEAEKIRDEKVEVFKALHVYSDNEVKENVVRGQYSENIERSIPGYRQESRVPNDSNTETFVAIKLAIENERWAGVPFYIRTGKQLKRKSVEVVLQFKPRPLGLMFCSEAGMIPNQLIIRIQPTEGVFLRFNAKKPGQGNDTTPVGMDFCQNCSIGYNSPEAYEHLLYGAMKGDKTLFTRWDEIEYSWRFVDAIKSAWDKEQPDFPNYIAGSDGPKDADELMNRDGRQWLNES
jgi:glucose-6-phosphate 1-dehydrogenase